MHLSDFVFGLVGFAGFEALRLYKRMVANQRVVPKDPITYAVVVGVLAVFAGVVAVAFADGAPPKALFAGFSVPTGFKALGSSPTQESGKSPTAFDDVSLRTEPPKRKGFGHRLGETIREFAND